MKYVMFTHAKTGLRVPVFCADRVTHADLRAGDGFVPTSAGFLSLEDLSTVGRSDSLWLSPEPDDIEIIKIVLAGMEAMSYVQQDTEANLAKLRTVMAGAKSPDSPAKPQ